METPSGIKDSIPAWIKYSVQAAGEIPYNGIYYDPPEEVPPPPPNTCTRHLNMFLFLEKSASFVLVNTSVMSLDSWKFLFLLASLDCSFYLVIKMFYMTMQEKYIFKHPQPKRPKSLRIYETHVGMSSTVMHLFF